LISRLGKSTGTILAIIVIELLTFSYAVAIIFDISLTQERQ